MAPSFIVMTAVLLFAAATPHVAYSQATVTGQLCCTSTGNCPDGPGIPGQTVSLNCTNLLGTTMTVGQATTNANGTFRINIVPNLLASILSGGDLSTCSAVVNLPLNQTVCPVLSTVNGALVGAVTSLHEVLLFLITKIV